MSVKGIGTDIVEVKRMKKKILKEKFILKVFTQKEIEYCNSKSQPAQHYAARFAAKESYMKAIGTGWSNSAKFEEIEIINDEKGTPEIILHGGTSEYFENSSFSKILLSLSHTKRQAVAFVVIS